jgi:hypothetical protein
MKYLQLYQEFVSSETNVNYKKGEFEVKEMFRIFAKLQDKLPNYIDRSIFDSSQDDFGEPKEFEEHSDPKFDSKQLNTKELLNLKEFTIRGNGKEVKVDARKYEPFIIWTNQLFNSGELIPSTRKDIEKIAKDSNELGRGDFGEFLKDKELFSKMPSIHKSTIKKLDKRGYKSSEETGSALYNPDVKRKYPELKKKILTSAKYDYYKGTWGILDKQIKEGEVSASSVIEIDGKMYLVGGNRRMAYYLGSGINPKIWKIKL